MTKITLITGATGGLGVSLAKRYKNENLLLVATNKKRLEDLKETLIEDGNNNIIDTFEIDLTKKDSYNSLITYCKEKSYFVNRLVNNAGFGDRCDFEKMDVTKQMNMIDVNCSSVIYFTRVFLDDMIKYNEGVILNISSIASFYPGPFMSTYHATKALVTNFTLALHHELKKTNIIVRVICPGPFESNFVNIAHNDYTFTKMKPISSDKVSEICVKAEKKKKVVTIIGFGAKLQKFFSRFVPNSIICITSSKTIKK